MRLIAFSYQKCILGKDQDPGDGSEDYSLGISETTNDSVSKGSTGEADKDKNKNSASSLQGTQLAAARNILHNLMHVYDMKDFDEYLEHLHKGEKKDISTDVDSSGEESPLSVKATQRKKLMGCGGAKGSTGSAENLARIASRLASLNESGDGEGLFDSGPIINGWPTLQVKLLESLMTLTHNANDHVRCVEYCSYFLQKLYPHLSVSEQKNAEQLLHENVGKALTNQFTFNWRILPAVDGVQPLHAPLRLCPTQRRLSISEKEGVQVSEEKNPFIYSPFAKAKDLLGAAADASTRNTPIWTANESFQVRVILSNPFHFGIEVENISIRARGLPYECYPSSTVVPAKCKRLEVIIEGRVLFDKNAFSSLEFEKNLLSIDGCVIRSFKNDSFHPVPKASAFEIVVVPPMPVLSLLYKPCDFMIDQTALTLFEGEIFNGTLYLVNESMHNEMDVEHVLITATDDSFPEIPFAADKGASSHATFESIEQSIYGDFVDVLRSSNRPAFADTLFQWPDSFRTEELVPIKFGGRRKVPVRMRGVNKV